MVRTVVLSLAACLLLAGTAVAAELRIGVADMQAVGIQCDANQAAKNKFEAQFKSEAAQLEKQKAEFDKKAKDFEAQRGKLDQKTFEQRVAGLRREAQQISDKEMSTQQRVGTRQEAHPQAEGDLAIAAAADVAKSKNLDLVLTQNTILYTSESLNVTDAVLEAMNRLWKERGSKVPGGDADSPAAAPAASAPARPKK
jgi:Skp family chaperone for outer membrane proteins